jgi:exodeoxyribonuclease VII small subunit
MTAEQVKNLSFEAAYERLSDTTARLERGNLSLNDSLALYEEGVLLSQHCENLLNNAQLKVSQISAALNTPEPDEDEEDYFFGEAGDE